MDTGTGPRADAVEWRPGPTNSLVDVRGLRVGHAQRVEPGWRTGVTVVLAPPAGATAGVDVRGGGPATRETDALDPRNLVPVAHAVVLAGGSAFGLAAADGVLRRLAADRVGFRVGPQPDEVVPIVPAAAIFDLGRGGEFGNAPDAGMGAAACDAAGTGPVPAGSVGAGTGARAGDLAGGIGSASVVLRSGLTVAALVVVNAVGSAVDPRTGELYGARYGLAGEFDPVDGGPAGSPPPPPRHGPWNTTIGVLATDAGLTRTQCARLAMAGHDGIARAVRPAHTMYDGDTLFALATHKPTQVRPDVVNDILAAGADTVARAVAHGVLAATAHPDLPAHRSTG